MKKCSAGLETEAETGGEYMVIFNITAFFVCLFVLSYVWKTTTVEMFPPLICMLTLVLYVLALIRHLSFIDGISILVIAAFVFWLLRQKKEQRIEFTGICLKNAAQPSFITAVCLLLPRRFARRGRS